MLLFAPAVAVETSIIVVQKLQDNGAPTQIRYVVDVIQANAMTV